MIVRRSHRLPFTGLASSRRRGVLSFEWILLITLLVIGTIGGLAAVRDSLVCELRDLSRCIRALNICRSRHHHHGHHDHDRIGVGEEANSFPSDGPDVQFP